MRRDASAQITLRGLVTARWVLLGLLTAAILALVLRPAAALLVLGSVPSPSALARLGAALGLWAALNAATARWVVAPGRARQWHAGAHLLVDAAALTLLLAWTGGAANPFTTLYFVPITLATQVSPRWTWSLAAVTVAGFAVLFALAPLPGGGHHAHQFASHLRGMWLAFGASGLLITYFVHSIALRLAQQRTELLRLREEALQDRHLASLGSLAAGAAHELGTPLGTITVLAGELEHMDEAERRDAIEQIERELARCKGIVERMATPDARVTAMGRGAPSWPVAELVDELDGRGVQLEVEVDASARLARCSQPRQALAQVVRELVSNGSEACRRRPGSRGLRLHLQVQASQAVLRLVDDGIGMAPALAEAAFDPFVSTKPEHEGMGLGLYLARAQVRQLGGRLRLRTAPDRGTEVELLFPLRADPEAG